MTSKAKQVVDRLEALALAVWPGADVWRNLDKPEIVGPNGMAILREGDPGDPIDVMLSPLQYIYEHTIPFQYAVRANPATADADLDAQLALFGAAIAADRTLGGLCDWVEVTAAQKDTLRADGTKSGRWADFDVLATYATRDPLN